MGRLGDAETVRNAQIAEEGEYRGISEFEF